MYPRIVTVKRGEKVYRYLRIVESVRQDGRVRQRTVVDLGSLAQHSEDEWSVVAARLQRLLGTQVYLASEIEGREVQSYGEVLVAKALWEQLELTPKLEQLVPSQSLGYDFPLAILVQVLNRLMAPRSRLALMQWVEGVYLPEPEEQSVQLHQLYRSLGVLARGKQRLEEALFVQLRDLLSLEVDVVLYDVTSTYFEGHRGPEQAAHGYSRDKRPDCRQVLLGLVTTRDGLPIGHHVFAGNRVDSTTVQEVVASLRERFQIGRLIFVGDRGMVSRANVEAIAGSGYEYIMGVRKRGGTEAAGLLAVPLEQYSVVGEGVSLYEGRGRDEAARYLVCHSAERVVEEEQILAGKLRRGHDRLAAVARRRGLSRDELIAAAAQALTQVKARKYFRFQVDEGGRLHYAEDDEAVAVERQRIGKYVLKTNAAELSAEECLHAYKLLQEVEAAFRTMKDVLQLRPIYLWNQEHVEGHIAVCVLAYLLHKLLQLRLRQAGVTASVSKAWDAVAKVRLVTLSLPDQTLRVITRPDPLARKVFRAVGIPHIPSAI
jgi:IS4 transposase